MSALSIVYWLFVRLCAQTVNAARAASPSRLYHDESSSLRHTQPHSEWFFFSAKRDKSKQMYDSGEGHFSGYTAVYVTGENKHRVESPTADTVLTRRGAGSYWSLICQNRALCSLEPPEVQTQVQVPFQLKSVDKHYVCLVCAINNKLPIVGGDGGKESLIMNVQYSSKSLI